MRGRAFVVTAFLAAGVAFWRGAAGSGLDDGLFHFSLICVVAVGLYVGGISAGITGTLLGTAILLVVRLGVGPLQTADGFRVLGFVGTGTLLSVSYGRINAAHERAKAELAALVARDRLVQELTGRPGTVAALRTTERYFERLAAAVPQILWAAPPSGRPDYCNRRYYEAFGLDESSVLSAAGLAATLHPDDAPLYRAAWADALRTGEASQVEYRLKSAGGDEYRWHLGRFLPVRDEAGRVERWFNTSTDVDAQKRADALSRANAALPAEIGERQRAEEARADLQRQLAAAQEAERSRIARELHDHLGQYLTAIGFGLRVVEDSAPLPPPARERLLQLRKLTESVGRDVHRLAVELRPSILDDVGLTAAIQTHLADWAERAGVEADFIGTGGDAGAVPKAVESAAYRIVQEALTNVLRHAGASRVSVVVRWAAGGLYVAVEDDGKGFDADGLLASPDGGGRLGLRGMRERAAQLGGTLAIDSTPGRGTAVIARLPARTPGVRHE